MNRSIIVTIFATCIGGCSGSVSRQSPRFATENDARLISIVREAAMDEDYSLKDAIYQVRSDGNGWVVQVDRAPGYTGVGEPLVIVDATFVVKFNRHSDVTDILTFPRHVKASTRPNGE